VINRTIVGLSVAVLTVISGITFAQFQQNPRMDMRDEPIYPRKPYEFRSTPPGYDPFQFNWNTGRWDYAPIPYEQNGSPYQFNWHSGQWDYRPWPGAGTSEPPAKQDLPPAQQNDDSQLWERPTTQPASGDAPRERTVQGRLIGMRAVTLSGDPNPEILLRLRDTADKTTTVCVGQRLPLPDAPITNVSAKGKEGMIDGSPVLFADEITINAKSQNVDRDP